MYIYTHIYIYVYYSEICVSLTLYCVHCPPYVLRILQAQTMLLFVQSNLPHCWRGRVPRPDLHILWPRCGVSASATWLHRYTRAMAASHRPTWIWGWQLQMISLKSMAKHLSRWFLDSLPGDVWQHFSCYMAFCVYISKFSILISEESFLTFSIYWTWRYILTSMQARICCGPIPRTSSVAAVGMTGCRRSTWGMFNGVLRTVHCP